MPFARRALILSLSAASIAALAYGAYRALHSPLFVVKTVEVSAHDASSSVSPVDERALLALAAVPVGKVGLFDLDLTAIERRLLTHPWIKEVHLQKRLPQTLSITPVFRAPVAVLALPQGRAAYVDDEGHAFGDLDPALGKDLPVISGFGRGEEPPVREGRVVALNLIREWAKSPLAAASLLAAIDYDSERGYRVLASYALKGQARRARATVELGQEIDARLAPQFRRLSQVVQYLSSNSIVARQIWVDTGKKIVVKTARGS